MIRRKFGFRWFGAVALPFLLGLFSGSGLLWGAQGGWEAAWEKALAGAKKEGRLVLSGPPGELWRRALMVFEQDYPQIKVEYSGMNSRDFWPRVLQERKLGKFIWDLRVGGPDPQVYQAKDDGVLDPVGPLLVLPEVVDGSKWLGGAEGLFADKENRYLPGFLAYARTTIMVNRDVIPEAALKSQKELLEPRWKGKIVLQDPRGGAGLAVLTVMLAGHGEAFIRELLTKQDVVVTENNRQQAEWVVQGRYPIGIGLSTDQLIIFEEGGLKFNVKRLEEGPKGLNIGFGGIQLLNRPPNPNASMVFINWLLTRKVQQHVSQTIRQNSRRLDVPPVDAAEVPDLKKLNEYFPHQEEKMLPVRRLAQQISKELIK